LREFLEQEKNDLDGCQQLLSAPNISLWLKWGSRLAADLPLVKVKYLFSASLNPLTLLVCMHENRQNWDKNIAMREVLQELSPEVVLIHYALKAPVPFMQSRDFVEKKIGFFEGTTHYGYASSTPDTVHPVTSQYLRAATIFSGHTLQIEGDNLVYWTFSQVDMKVLFHVH
jgi:hypothetical protein